MKSLFVYIILLFIVVLGCKSPKETKGEFGSRYFLREIKLTRIVEENWIAAYLIFQKECLDNPTSQDVEDWIDSKLFDLEREGCRNSMFEHRGGGPHGSQWNPWGEMLFVCHILPDSGESLTHCFVQLNNKTLFVDVETDTLKNGYMFYSFILPQKDWEGALTPMQISDIESVYADKPDVIESWNAFLKNTDSDEYTYEAAVGKIARIKTTLTFTSGKKIEFNSIFHASYGE